MANPPSLQKYIPAGCFPVSDEACNVPPQIWSSPDLKQWNAFVHPGDTTPTDHQLSAELQELLLRSLTLDPFSRLFQRRWIQLEFRISADDPRCGVCRVYVLPDDVDRRSVSRSEGKLRKELQTLLSKLDYSTESWNGRSGAHRSPRPLRSRQDGITNGGSEEDVSLLQMFNTIPSPKPLPDLVKDPEHQRAMDALATSKVSGLKTRLYGYQTRSAALMLQREVCPGQVLDPRLLRISDQHDNAWYFDDVTGMVLREPRHYDGIAGGILAEEMGTGKTLICLALILATRAFPAETPDIHRSNVPQTRPKVGSLADMAAAALTRHSVPWKLYLGAPESDDYEYTRCIEAIQRNPGWYLLPRFEARRENRNAHVELPPQKIFLSTCSLVIVPTNLVRQWEQEIQKHTTGLKVLVITGKQEIPATQELLDYDILLFSISRFEKLKQDRTVTRNGWEFESPLATIHFKRVIVDEGHKLGNSKMGKKSDILLVLECLNVSARWIVTGTPSTGLFGVEISGPSTPISESSTVEEITTSPTSKKLAASSSAQERKDLERIGAMATLYLKARPWANTLLENGDTLADWSVYVMQPKHSNRSSGRKDCLRATLDSLIIRHRMSEVGDLLPPVDEKVVYLDGSYQDNLCLNLFSMMIIFNAVQSQRTDQDYFFHPSRRPSLLQLVSNIRQSSFFGGYFFSQGEIFKAIETAEKFLEEKKVPVSEEDEQLLHEAIAFGRVAMKNHLKQLADKFHEVPVYVKHFPGGGEFARAWSIDDREGELVCTDAPMIRALQKFLRPCIDAPHSLQAMFNDGRFVQRGNDERLRALEQQLSASQTASTGTGAKQAPTLAGNTKLGEDSSPIKRRSGSLGTPARMEGIPTPKDTPEIEIAEPLARAQIVSTSSAKLSYLIDSIVAHQADEQMIVFYEHDNVAFYLAEQLEILQIHHLIYARGITAARRAQYVDTFNHNPKFRVLLMDISQAAFGLDMRSASRIYFINPILNPQVEAQAIGRVRRISQKRQVSVETLVLRRSLEEVIMERRQSMTQAEHRRLKSILDDRAIYEWILHAKIRPLEPAVSDGGDDEHPAAQMAPLKTPQFLFGRGFGRVEHPDEGLVASKPVILPPSGGLKRAHAVSTAATSTTNTAAAAGATNIHPDLEPRGEEPPVRDTSLSRKPKRAKIGVSVRFAATPEAEESSGGGDG